MTTRCAIAPGGLESAVEGSRAVLRVAEGNSRQAFVRGHNAAWHLERRSLFQSSQLTLYNQPAYKALFIIRVTIPLA